MTAAVPALESDAATVIVEPLDPVLPRAVPAAGARPTSVAERAFDLAVALAVLPFALVIGALIAIAVYVDSPGPIFYRCARVGQGGRVFSMLKFRKMHRTAAGGPLTLHGDERFTPIGNFLALTKLDELPQLWNVIRGDMRLVGPRPEVEEFVRSYPEPYREILTALPGITGPAAVEFANESRLLTASDDVHSFYRSELLPRKIDLDLSYVRTRSIAGDARLLARTSLTPFVRLVHAVRRHPRGRAAHMLARIAWTGAVCALVVAFAVSNGPL